MDSRFVPGSDTNRMVQNNSARPSIESFPARRATTTRPMLVSEFDGVKVADGHEPVLGKHYTTPSQPRMDALGVVSSSNADIVSRSGGRVVRG